jgi:hypothetical protein
MEPLKRTPLNSDEIKRVLRVLGQNKDRRDLLIFKLMIFEAFKIGVVVGSDDRKWVNKKWVPKPQTFAGLRIEDITDKGIRVRPRNREPYEKVFKYREVLHEIVDYVSKRKRGKIFRIGLSRMGQVVRKYAKKAGLSEHEKVRSQMFVDFSRNFKHENLMQLLGLEFTAEEVTRLIQNGEGLELEFKRELSGKHSEFCETMVSFANLHGGKILIGVENNGSINGVPESQLPKIDDIITSISHSHCDPFVPHALKVVPINNTQVVVVQIDEGADKPYWLKIKGPMIRTGPHHEGARDRLMTRQETEQAFRRYFQKTR